ncbi:MAG: transposase [Acetobacteraceae bacterium]|nr:transposase [Acetobacteraceae bacterium]
MLPRYARMTRQVEALIASTYLAGTNTRRVKRALAALFKSTVGKDVVSRVWRKVKTDWEAWTRRDLANEDIVRLILDGSVVRVRLDRRATNISLLVVLGRSWHPPRWAKTFDSSAKHGRRERIRLA